MVWKTNILCTVHIFTFFFVFSGATGDSLAGPSYRERQAWKESKTKRTPPHWPLHKHTHPCKEKRSSCLLVSKQHPTIWHFGGRPMQRAGGDGKTLSWETLHVTPMPLPSCHRGECCVSRSNWLVPPELLTRKSRAQGGLCCGLMSLLDGPWQAQTRTNIAVDRYQKQPPQRWCISVR